MIVLVGLGVVRTLSGGPGAGSADCPTGRPAGRVDTYSASQVGGSLPMPMPGADTAPDPTPMFELRVSFEVANETSAPIVVVSVDAGIIGDPGTRITGSASSDPLAPGDSISVDAMTVVESFGGMEPTPDSGSVTVYATWSDEDDRVCDGPPSSGAPT